MRSLIRPVMCGVAVLACAALALPTDVQAQTITTDELVSGLQPKARTRSFDPSAPKREAAEKELRTKLRSFDSKTRKISVEERKEVVKLIEEAEAPSVDVQILFAFDSDEILPEARPDLDALGKALSNSKLKSGTFLIAGHTDAKGSEDYNLDLSQRRAESVKRFLVGTYGIDSEALKTLGFGEEELKNEEDPHADENRRVQITNLGGGAVAEAKTPPEKPAPAAKAEPAPADADAPPADAEAPADDEAPPPGE